MSGYLWKGATESGERGGKEPVPGSPVQAPALPSRSSVKMTANDGVLKIIMGCQDVKMSGPWLAGAGPPADTAIPAPMPSREPRELPHGESYDLDMAVNRGSGLVVMGSQHLQMS